MKKLLFPIVALILALGLALPMATPVRAAPLPGANADIVFAWSYGPGTTWYNETIDVNDAGADDFYFGFGNNPPPDRCLYLGMNSPFRQIVVNITTVGAAAGAALWEYWNGVAWSSLEGLAGFNDPTNDFKNPVGMYTITFATTLPGDWATTTVNGTAGLYWVRAKTTAGYGPATSPQGGQVSAILNSPPDAVDDNYTTDEDTPFADPAPGVLTNDTDPDSDPLTVALWTPPAKGIGVLFVNGRFEYDPNGEFEYLGVGDSEIVTFSYTADDGNGGTDTATGYITVNGVNDAPDAVDDPHAIDEDSLLSVGAPGVLGNDTDPDGDLPWVEWYSDPAIAGAGHNNMWGDGSFDYDPRGVFDYLQVGDSANDWFNYGINDGNGGVDAATVYIQVTGVNDPPVAVDDPYVTNEDMQLIVLAPGVLGNDTDVDGDPLTIPSCTVPLHGTLVLMPDGSFTYTPDPNYNGPDSFDYTIDDGMCGTDTGTVNITVNPVNDPPVATDDGATTNQNVPVNIAVLGNDTDIDGDPLSVTGVTDPPNGTAVIELDNTVTYTPIPGSFGADSFDYTVSDGNGGTDTATVNVRVNSPSPAGGGGGVVSVDNTPPVLSGIGSGGVNDTEADITWATDEESTSQVEYWASPSTLSPLDKTLVLQHLIHLTGLTPGTTYHYRTMSRDVANNLAVSAVYTFTTLGEAPSQGKSTSSTASPGTPDESAVTPDESATTPEGKPMSWPLVGGIIGGVVVVGLIIFFAARRRAY